MVHPPAPVARRQLAERVHSVIVTSVMFLAPCGTSGALLTPFGP